MWKITGEGKRAGKSDRMTGSWEFLDFLQASNLKFVERQLEPIEEKVCHDKGVKN